GWAGRGLLAASIAGSAAVLVLAWRVAAPAADIRPAVTTAGFLALLVAAGSFDLAGRLGRLGRTGQPLCAAVLVGLIAAALSHVGDAGGARQRIAARGISSLLVLKTLWTVTDRDKDGFSPRFGGGDCDDGNPAVHPGAREI